MKMIESADINRY